VNGTLESHILAIKQTLIGQALQGQKTLSIMTLQSAVLICARASRFGRHAVSVGSVLAH
jgi:hypothetical protein